MNTLIIKIIGGFIGVIFTGFSVYIITPFFVSKRLDEALPVTELVVDTTTAATSNQTTSIMPPSVIEESGTVKAPNKETVPVAAETQAPITATTQDQSVAPIAPTTPTAAIIGTQGHPAEGQVRIVSSGGKQYVRYENFKTINGPDLVVYLSKDLEAKQYVSLGKLKATEGNINYEIPNGVNVGDYKYALVWCDAFSVLFNSAEL